MDTEAGETQSNALQSSGLDGNANAKALCDKRSGYTSWFQGGEPCAIFVMMLNSGIKSRQTH